MSLGLANRISIARVVLVPFFVAFIVYSRFRIALAIFLVCMASDFIDGYIARTKNQQTRLGSLLDPIADKLLLISGFVSLSFVNDLPSHLSFPPYVPLIIVSRDVLIIIGCMVIYLLKGRIEIRPTRIGKITTFFQMISVVSILVWFPYTRILWAVTVALTLFSGLDYLRIGTRMLNEA